jgi:hypothetical protein
MEDFIELVVSNRLVLQVDFSAPTLQEMSDCVNLPIWGGESRKPAVGFVSSKLVVGDIDGEILEFLMIYGWRLPDLLEVKN